MHSLNLSSAKYVYITRIIHSSSLHTMHFACFLLYTALLTAHTRTSINNPPIECF